MRLFKFTAALSAVVALLLVASPASAAVYTGPWQLQWDFQSFGYEGWTPYGTGALNPAPIGVMPNQGNGGDFGLNQVNTGQTRYVEYRLPQTYTQFIFQTDLAWNILGDRMRGIGMGWRNDPLDNNVYTSEGWLEGNNTGPTDREKLRLGGTGIPTSGGTNNLQGKLSEANLIGVPSNVTLQVQANWGGSGVYNVYYRSNFNAGPYGQGNWQLLASFANTPALLDGINELKLGGNQFNSAVGNAWFDHVAFIGAVPEPSSMILLGLAAPVVGGLVWRRRKAR